ncbi:MAG: polyprenyl synthetase family protein [Alphaproteobacteria bacterium]|nr:polyprenyl synthetase family protein [Alphaproteobacteria bacterium]MDE1985371.1 polyprenyl synthetase family protein [Alphaproteobacteria bacterium]MDE2162002.1 polyprenyl synthetase family protein [Alphaproteobacteria bacterium]MDE2265424.1 polyprenyl synthetase family protein [Alphaproteobacteria bacterium]MDE2499045.1 polyprenyl synthetase family protein [Alphaproteobacteria bacterium]
MLAPELRRSNTKDPGVSPVERLLALVPADMQATDALIHERLGSTVNLIPDLARHLIDSGGKRLRPLLTLAAAHMAGYEGNGHVRLAASVEFIHTATLLHDDVVDASSLRRGKVSANIVWGNKPSVLVGDYLFSRAFQLMVETGELAVLDILAGASAIIAEGEVMQLKSANNLATTEEHYLRVVSAKTAALFAAAAEAGAVLASHSTDYIAAMRSYGDNLGIAFQLVDDALDYSGRQALMGKSVGDDFREGKVTLPVILAYARADEAARRFWKRAIETGPQSESDLDRAITLVEETGAISETMARARTYADQACQALSAVGPCETRDVLADIADFCVERAY